MKPIDPLNNEILRIKATLARRSFKAFVKQAWPILYPATPLQTGYMHDAICEHIQAVRDGEITRLICNAPPRQGKSSLVSILAHPWIWATYPSANFLFTSFKSSLAEDFALKSQKVVFSEWYEQSFGNVVKFDKTSRKTIEAYDNLASGERRAGVYGSSTGFGPSGVLLANGKRGASFLCVDDPHNVEGLSDEVRRKDLETFDTGLSTRVQHGAAILIFCQRLHDMDLSGYLLERGGYEHLNLPNEFEVDRKCFTVGSGTFRYEDPRTEDGELLWPEVCTPEVTEERKRSLGSFAYAGQYQQRPVPKSGGLIDISWFQTWTTQSLPPKFDETLISWDFSFKGNAKSDWCVGQAWGRKDANYYLLDQVRKQMDFSATKRAVLNLCDRWPNIRQIVIEDSANGPAILSELRSVIPGLIGIKPKDSKEARVSAISPWIESGNVFIPETATWKEAFLYECSLFPKSAHDDQVDAMSQALLRFSNTRGSKIVYGQHTIW